MNLFFCGRHNVRHVRTAPFLEELWTLTRMTSPSKDSIFNNASGTTHDLQRRVMDSGLGLIVRGCYVRPSWAAIGNRGTLNKNLNEHSSDSP